VRKTNLGREIVACALRIKNLKPFLEAGIDEEWLTDQEDMSRVAIFTEQDRSAYLCLLRHWSQHRKTPTVDMFRLGFPEASYRLPDTSYTSDELVELYKGDVERLTSQLAVIDIAEEVEAGNFKSAVELMEAAARKIRNARISQDVHVIWDAEDYDLDAKLDRKILPGIKTGIPELDDSFGGFRPGNLITYLGRAKSGKSSFLLKTALDAWENQKSVMFLTVEIDAEGITDRLDAFASGINYMKYAMGELSQGEKSALRDFRTSAVGDSFFVVQPLGKYTITDLEYDVDRYECDAVFVDGFYFMIDRNTGKSGGSWEGHDNLAREMKEVAMRHRVPLVTTMQVREKQLTGKKGNGIDDGAIMGGTGLIMASDMVLGFDADPSTRLHTINCTRSRTGYLPTVKGLWDWTRCSFAVTEVVGNGTSASPSAAGGFQKVSD
jgi:hypothetical protein